MSADDKRPPYFAPAAEREIKDVDDSHIRWPEDAKQIADDAALGSYGDGLDEELAREDQLANALEHDLAGLKKIVKILVVVVAVLVLSNIALWWLR